MPYSNLKVTNHSQFLHSGKEVSKVFLSQFWAKSNREIILGSVWRTVRIYQFFLSHGFIWEIENKFFFQFQKLKNFIFNLSNTFQFQNFLSATKVKVKINLHYRQQKRHVIMLTQTSPAPGGAAETTPEDCDHSCFSFYDLQLGAFLLLFLYAVGAVHVFSFRGLLMASNQCFSYMCFSLCPI